uniref:ZM domain-containing protein n=1 Tax=Caenorhabditis tropicalis TaxID=1561998 RepID=A0A1I7T5Z0_9PELO
MNYNRNSRGNGYTPSSSTSFPGCEDRYERWNDETEWSARDETWRGNPNRNGPPARERTDSWKDSSNLSEFRLGRDRAPMPVDDQFLVRYGAKRLNNGNLVDRDGYTLRTRDPNCRAPSPPNYNPGRALRRNGNNPSSGINRMSQDMLDEKARQQMEMMHRLAEEAELEPKTRRVASEENIGRREEKYEDIEEPQTLANQIRKECILPAAPLPVPKNNIKKPLLASPPGPPKAPMRNVQPYKQHHYYEEYQRNVEHTKEQAYSNPTSSASSSRYYFPKDHQNTCPPPFYPNGPNQYSSYQAYPSIPDQQYAYPNDISALLVPPPPPPPPSIGYSGASSSFHASSTSSIASPYHSAGDYYHQRRESPYRDARSSGINAYASPNFHRPPETPSPRVIPTPPSTVNAFGVFTGNAHPVSPKEFLNPENSSDTDSDDETFRALQEICRPR